MPKVEKRLPKAALTVEEAETVLSLPDLSTATGVRDRAMIEVFYGTGIRRSELARLNVRDLDVDRRTLMVRQGKGRKDRMVPIGPRALAWIDRYLVDVRPSFAAEPDDGTLFLTVDGTGFSLDRLTQLVRDYVKASGVDKEGACHLFRHTLATLMLEGGADIRYIQAMLGTPNCPRPRSTPKSASGRCRRSMPRRSPEHPTVPSDEAERRSSRSNRSPFTRCRRNSCLLLSTPKSKKRTAATPDRSPGRREPCRDHPDGTGGR